MRGLSGTELLELQATLRSQETIYSQQGMGGKSMTRDLRRLDDKLAAIQYVINERTPPVILPAIGPNIGVGIANFGCVQE